MSTDDCASDVTEFAALLTELKGRTERSYGSLARRLGMNTSTLHRYCAGEAVPQDFAPVERLAEFCGATPEERLELHRQWLRLAATRHRLRGAPATETPEQADTAAIAGAAGGGSGERTAETAERPVTPETRGTRQAPETQKPPAIPQHAEAPAAHETSADPGIVVSTVAATQKSASTQVPPPRWYRRRRTTVLVGAGCALLATLGALSALPGGSHRHPSKSDDAARSALSPDVSSPAAAPDRSSTPAPNTTSASVGSTAPSSPPGHGGTTSVAEAAPAGGGPPVAPAAGVPLSWTADSQIWAQGCGHDYVIDRPPAQVPPPPMAQDAKPWASAQGAVHGRETNVEITLQGRSSTVVFVTAVRVRVAGRAAPAPGTAYAMEQGCGGSLSRRHFAVDLDRDAPVARSVAGNDADSPIPAVSLPYRVSGEVPEVLLVTARTENCDCTWYLELGWSAGGRTGTVRVDDHGRPFRTTSIKGLPRYWYGSEGGERRWVPATD